MGIVRNLVLFRRSYQVVLSDDTLTFPYTPGFSKNISFPKMMEKYLEAYIITSLNFSTTSLWI